MATPAERLSGARAADTRVDGRRQRARNGERSVGPAVGRSARAGRVSRGQRSRGSSARPGSRRGRAERWRATWGGGNGADVLALRGGGAGGAGRGGRGARAPRAAPSAPLAARAARQIGAPRPARPATTRQAQSPLPDLRLVRSVHNDSSRNAIGSRSLNFHSARLAQILRHRLPYAAVMGVMLRWSVTAAAT